MIKITTLLWVMLLVVAGGTVMHVSYQVRHVQTHLSRVARDTHQQEDAIRILSAEWDTLNDPRRIDELSKRLMPLESTPIARVVALESIPLKPSDDQLAKMAADAAKKVAKNHPNPQAPKAADPMPGIQKSPAIVVAASVAPRPIQATPTVARTVSFVRAPAFNARPRDEVGLILAKIEGRQ